MFKTQNYWWVNQDNFDKTVLLVLCSSYLLSFYQSVYNKKRCPHYQECCFWWGRHPMDQQGCSLVGKFKSESWRITKGVNQLNQQQEIVFFKGGLHGETHLPLDSQRVRTEEPMNMLGLGLKGPCGLISGLKVIKASVAQTVGSGCKRPLWLKLWFQG